MKEEIFMKTIWEEIVKYYTVYSDFIHSIFPSQLGDLVVYLIDIVVIVLIIKMIASLAFGNKEI